MSRPRVPSIQMISDPRTAPLADSVVFVGGPLEGTRRTIDNPPAMIASDGGVYRRSVHCADDGAVRYVFEPASDST